MDTISGDVDEWAVVEALAGLLANHCRITHVASLAVGIVSGSTSPSHALTQLEELYEAFIPDLDATARQPVADMGKCISVERFVDYYADERLRLEFISRSTDRYADRVSAAPEPSAVLTADLPTDPGEVLIPAPYSWLVPYTAIDSYDGAQLVEDLRLPDDADPPLISLRFPLDDMLRTGVQVRVPDPLDTIPVRITTWIPGDVPDEVIDGNIERGACGEASWHP